MRRFAQSSLEVYEHYVADNPDFFEIFGLSRAEYAPGEGAVSIRVRGALVGVIAVSGLESGRVTMISQSRPSAQQSPRPADLSTR